ncbi:MAG: DNA polymerase III subunit delta' [Pseudomonadota bacterium]
MSIAGMMFPWLNPLSEDLNRAIEFERFGHAPLLMGSSGVGKRRLAEWLARRLLCLAPEQSQPCGQCKSCTLFESATHPDFFRLQIEDDKTAILIDQVRELTTRIVLTPSIGSRRIGLIHSAERMNTNAANALLKTLEEPAAETWLILISDRPQQLPATILSRCQRWVVPLPNEQQALDWLHSECPSVSQDDRTLALSLADGSPQTAANWLSGGEFEFGLAVRDQLNAILDDNSELEVNLAQWQENPELSWRWLARWTQVWTRRAMSGQSGGLTGEGLYPYVQSPAGLDALQKCWQQALQGARLANKPVRHDWLMQTWLLQWRSLLHLRS